MHPLLADFLFKLGYILCFPCAWYLKRTRQRSHDVRDSRRAPPGSKPVTLRSRRRALTLALPEDGHKRQHTNSQSASPLFAKLPYELRHVIWEESITGMTVHLQLAERHLRGIVCTSSETPNSADHVCWRSARQDQGQLEMKARHQGRRLLSLLLTCRRTYSEAIDILYSANTFDVLDPRLMLYMPDLFLPRRLDVLSSLHLLWHLREVPIVPAKTDSHIKIKTNYNDSSWVAIWHNIASLKGLQHLRVELEISRLWAPDWTQLERMVLEPVKDVTAPKDFVLVLPFAGGKDLEEEELPCRIVRTS